MVNRLGKTYCGAKSLVICASKAGCSEQLSRAIFTLIKSLLNRFVLVSMNCVQDIVNKVSAISRQVRLLYLTLEA